MVNSWTRWGAMIVATALAACATGVGADNTDPAVADVDAGRDDGASSGDLGSRDDAAASGFDASQAQDASPPPTHDAAAVDASTPDSQPPADAAPPPPPDAAPTPQPDASGGVCADPNTPAACHSCSGSNCQANGCYGGYWCNTSTNKCHAPGSC